MITVMTLALLIVVLLGILLTKGFMIFFKVLGALALIALVAGLIIGLFGVGVVLGPIIIDVIVAALMIWLIIILVKKGLKKK